MQSGGDQAQVVDWLQDSEAPAVGRKAQEAPDFPWIGAGDSTRRTKQGAREGVQILRKGTGTAGEPEDRPLGGQAVGRCPVGRCPSEGVRGLVIGTGARGGRGPPGRCQTPRHWGRSRGWEGSPGRGVKVSPEGVRDLVMGPRRGAFARCQKTSPELRGAPRRSPRLHQSPRGSGMVAGKVSGPRHWRPRRCPIRGAFTRCCVRKVPDTSPWECLREVSGTSAGRCLSEQPLRRART